MNAIWPIGKILETFEKNVGSRKITFSSWSVHLEISDFPHLWGKFLPSNGSKIFFTHFLTMMWVWKVIYKYSAIHIQPRNEIPICTFFSLFFCLRMSTQKWGQIFRLPTFCSRVSKIFPIGHTAFIFSLRHVFIVILDPWKIWRAYEKSQENI